jgi:hypothetical protein
MDFFERKVFRLRVFSVEKCGGDPGLVSYSYQHGLNFLTGY